MKCYYEELGVDRDASEAEIKASYRKLALRWHPDKNPERLEEAKRQFLLIQQAYEVLSDPQEKAFYDNHREQILRGKNSDYEENCLDVFEYFTSSCFNGYNDEENGFYKVYAEVFKKIAAEDSEFMDDEEDILSIPNFGDSTSSYEEVVGPFYAYWQSYCTKKTYTWLCPYDITEIKDRRILREIEKDMKKVVQKAKRERNEEVRNLVSFVRKRDKRVKAHKKVLEDRAALNREKQEKNRIEQIKKRNREVEEMKKTNIFNDEYEEQLKQLEQEYGPDDSEEESENCENKDLNQIVENTETLNLEDYIDDLYCVACNRSFKNQNAFINHETSRKHRENLEYLSNKMIKEETAYIKQNGKSENLFQETCYDDENDDVSGETEIEISMSLKKKKKNKKTKITTITSESEKSDEENMKNEVQFPSVSTESTDEWSKNSKKTSKKSKNKKSIKCNEQKTAKNVEPIVENLSPKDENISSDKLLHTCATCSSVFESKNKLFAHLKNTNHSIFLPKEKTKSIEVSETIIKKSKNKKK